LWLTGTLLVAFDNKYNNSLSYAMNPHGLYNGSAKRSVYQGSDVIDTWLMGDQTTYRYLQEIENFIAPATNAATGAIKGKKDWFVRYHIHQYKTRNRVTYGAAESEIKGWSDDAGTAYPQSTDIKLITLMTGARLYQSRAIWYHGSTAWNKIPNNGVIPPAPAEIPTP